MASRKSSFYGKPNSIFPALSMDDSPVSSDGLFEFDEADICNSSSSTVTESKKSTILSHGEPKKMGRKMMVMNMSMAEKGAADKVMSSSLPVNIPDWSKILKDGYKEQRKLDSDENCCGEFYSDDEEDDGGDGRVPPHEYLARTRGASFSVHEGIGRTLKGRDLRRVRNAIWKKVGFED
ncbi:hypothetical protein D8674_024525 [Pyrus ussuriensis x Pyrus communis]|uniref:Senescence regulator S40 n=1 Tax=Pyrus ussuriensis x Pyrus communis TaxID=2448454 RepID=A0A5N5H6Z8_9ROSA|nr:hypothetical protein D8674_024525 [Pyrus ussuriensis x Pyrus communis]